MQRMINGIRICLAKMVFKRAYVRYHKYMASLDCGETLGLYIGGYAANLRKGMEEAHFRLSKIDKNCPKMEYKIFQNEGDRRGE